MVDYYPILARAMSAPEARDPQWRRGVYERARQMLVTQLLARRPATPPDAIAAEQSGLDSAIRRIEAEMSRPARAAMPRQAPIDERPSNSGRRYRRSVGDRAGARAAADAVAVQQHLFARGRHRRRRDRRRRLHVLGAARPQSVAAAGQKRCHPPLPRKRRPRPRPQHPSRPRPKTAISRPASTAARPTTTCRMFFAASRRSIARCSRSAPSSSISCSIFSI